MQLRTPFQWQHVVVQIKSRGEIFCFFWGGVVERIDWPGLPRSSPVQKKEKKKNLGAPAIISRKIFQEQTKL